MSLSKDILIILSSYNDGYRIIRRRLAGLDDYPRDMINHERKKLAEATVKNTLSRLKKNKLIESNNTIWSITSSGIEYLDKLLKKDSVYKITEEDRSRKKHNFKNMIIAFDIPERNKNKRNLLRSSLKNLGFVMLQRSVWFGPAPLPKSFVKWLRNLNVIQYMKFFKASEGEIA